MASAAAVGADISKSPIREEDVDDHLGFTGGVEPVEQTEATGEDDDDDIAPTRRRPAAISSMGANGDSKTAVEDDDDDEPLPDIDADDADLFGDGGDDGEAANGKVRKLDDEELDSGDDEGRTDRAPQYDDLPDEQEMQEDIVLDMELGRHAIPEPSDGELYLLKIPRFLSIEPHTFSPDHFSPPTTDHHSKTGPSNTFSPYQTALTTLRWRQSPSDPSKLQSNARILRWSDGSLTLQFASMPTTQYRLPARSMAPPQTHPKKPTPLTGNLKGRRQRAGYSSEKDSFTYLLAPQAAAQILRTTNKLTTSLHVEGKNAPGSSHAVEELQLALARASAGGMGDAGGVGIVQITEDPELAKKKAELAEKEKMRAQKRREAQEVRNRERLDRGGRRPGFGGLTAAGLEDDDELGAGVPRPRSTKPRAKPRRSAASRRGEILTDDDEEGYGGRGRTREDEYDVEDDFLVDDEEEEEVVEEEEEEEDFEEGAVDDSRNKHISPKRPRERNDDLDAEGEPDIDAEGEPDDADDGAVGRGKRRRIIDDDEE